MITSLDNGTSFQSENISLKPWLCVLCLDSCVFIWSCYSVETKRDQQSCATFAKKYFFHNFLLI